MPRSSRALFRRWIAGGLLLAGATVVSAQSVEAQTVEFRGGGFFSFTSQCQAEGWEGTVYASARYRPPGVGSNGPSTRFSVFFPLFYATSFVLQSGNLTAAYKTVDGGGLGSQLWVYPTKPRMRVTLRSPSAVNASTEAVRLKGQINGFDNVRNCVVDFDVSLTRRP
ncbi:hypothetical protein EDC22_12012 [Tepidamorphus gemmatus]|uniref:Secreted protein n=1 Tax=Tepidamorphus gemmatus TaxID=747076 RepID=A0A4R3LUM3_9HYPH|nr:hypothetical protein [Tepidamorphus gemmatus]TCT03339.1 hypothetical protein EDC22_12012 [Tepidamorphus gemmatus]